MNIHTGCRAVNLCLCQDCHTPNPHPKYTQNVHCDAYHPLTGEAALPRLAPTTRSVPSQAMQVLIVLFAFSLFTFVSSRAVTDDTPCNRQGIPPQTGTRNRQEVSHMFSVGPLGCGCGGEALFVNRRNCATS